MTNEEQDYFTVVADKTLNKVGCVLIQAGYGANHMGVVNEIKVEKWFTSPTERMRLYRVPVNLRQKFIEIFNED